MTKKESELNYLRDEIKQILNFTYEHSERTISMVFKVWGGFAVMLGAGQFFDNHKLLFYSAGETIFFISVLILYFSIRKIRSNVQSLLKIAAYIMVFHEEEPSKDKDGKLKDAFCWETVLLDTDLERIKKNKENKFFFNVLNENNRETMYKVFMLISIIGIFLSYIILFFINEEFHAIHVLYLLYFLISIALFITTSPFTEKDASESKEKYKAEFKAVVEALPAAPSKPPQS